jgi:hypothetical protein
MRIDFKRGGTTKKPTMVKIKKKRTNPIKSFFNRRITYPPLPYLPIDKMI